MKKLVISKLFLYRYRFYIGFTVLGLVYLALLFGLPLLSPSGLSESEMISATTSLDLSFDSILHGNIIDLPYHALQKLSLTLFGLNTYAIKLPSIVVGALLGLLLILLLNRWFKTNVALLASILAVLSGSFLFLAGCGTPLIMVVFWPTLLLWLGSKIQGVTKPRPLYCFVFAFALLASIFTPHIIYLAVFIVIFAMVHPHLRFTIKTLPTVPLILTIFIILLGFASMVVVAILTPAIIPELLLSADFSWAALGENLRSGFQPFFSWNATLESIFLSPAIGLASVALAVIGLLSTAKGFFASRNAIAIWLVVFSVFLAAITPSAAILLLLPMAILTAHGIRYILTKWYDLFPGNPYARISAVFPLGFFLGVVIVSSINHFIFGYRYIPLVADQFNDDLSLIQEYLPEGATLYVVDQPVAYNLYRNLEATRGISVRDTLPSQDFPAQYATLGKTALQEGLRQIVSSPKFDNSDRLYLYSSS